MRRVGFSFVLIICLILPVLGFEKFRQESFDEESEAFIGRVKKVITTETWSNKVDGQWMEESSDSSTEEFARYPKAKQSDSDDLDSAAEESREPVAQDPVEAQQGEGYDAGYGSSSGEYGFYKLDEKDNILEAVHYSSNKELIERDYYTYDAEGKELEKITVKADGSLSEKVISLYNRQGKQTQEATYSKDGTLEEIWAWHYDEKNHIALTTLHRKGVLDYKETATYRYDSRGNWLRKESIIEFYDSGIPKIQKMQVIERSIFYYGN
jgi:hypothetical protein